MNQYPISVLVRREGSFVVVQCLEWDIAAQGTTYKEAMQALGETFVGQVAVNLSLGKKDLQDVPQAPKEYWDMFEEALRLEDRKPFYMGNALPPAYSFRPVASDLRVAV